jgi:hypothetical protein
MTGGTRRDARKRWSLFQRAWLGAGKCLGEDVDASYG